MGTGTRTSRCASILESNQTTRHLKLMNSQRTHLTFAATLAFALGAATQARASTLIAPNTASFVDPAVFVFIPEGGSFNQPVTVTDYTLGGSVSHSPVNLINGSGLSAIPTLANYTTITHAAPSFTGSAANAWSSIDPGSAGGDFFAQFGEVDDEGPAGFFNLSLSSQDLTGMVIWGAAGSNGNNVRSWRVYATTAAGSFVVDSIFTFAAGNEPTGSSPGVISFGTTLDDVSNLFLFPQDNYFGQTVNGSAVTGGARISLGEIRFITADPVPEPTTGLLGLLAVGGLTLRRRRS
jgi:MYXO-CTERM domain-containing protein